MISCIKNILEIALSNQTAGKTFFYNPANYAGPDIALDYGGFPLEPSIKNRNFRGNNRVIQQGPKGKRTFNQGFNQPEVWNAQQYFVDDWSQASNPMANANYPIGGQQSQLTNAMNSYQQPNNFNQQPTAGYQQQQPGAYPQQNVSYYLDPSGFASGTNSQLYNSSDLMSGQLAGQLGAAALNSNRIKTFWSSYYNGEDQNNLNVPIDGRVNMT